MDHRLSFIGWRKGTADGEIGFAAYDRDCE